MMNEFFLETINDVMFLLPFVLCFVSVSIGVKFILSFLYCEPMGLFDFIANFITDIRARKQKRTSYKRVKGNLYIYKIKRSNNIEVKKKIDFDI